MRFPHRLASGLVYAVVVVLGIYVAFGLLAGMRRTAEAPITIESLRPAETIGRAGPIPGWAITYRFQTADGTTVADEVFRLWDPAEIRSSKACYEPGDPGNHDLVLAIHACPR